MLQPPRANTGITSRRNDSGGSDDAEITSSATSTLRSPCAIRIVPVPSARGATMIPPGVGSRRASRPSAIVATARFADGTDRDVTDLVWYGSNNDRTAKVTTIGTPTVIES